MDETDKKIRELTEAMRAEQDARICNRMMAVRGILAGYPTKDAAYFADMDRRTVQLWVARFDEGGIGGLRDAPGRGRPPRAGYGRIRKLADRLAGKNMLTPRKLRNWIRGKLNARYSLCSVRRILRLLGFSSKRSATMYASAADSDAVRQWQAGAAGTISWAKRRGFAVVVQRHDPQLKIKSFSSNSYRSMFPNKQILRGYAENCAILCPSANYESSLRTSPYSSGLGQTEGSCGRTSGNPWP